jgi:KaiC/GvpD/RAD55 family RecA-like ATPase/tetratricopeptide (TPR) repeat protein
LEDHEEALRIFKEEYSLPDVANLLAGTGGTRSFIPIKSEIEKAFSEGLMGTALTHEVGFAQLEATYINIFIGGTFYSFGLFQEAIPSFIKALKIGERTGDFNNMSYSLAMIGELLGLASTSELEGTPQLLKALEYSLKTDSKLTQSRIYANLVARYMRLGDLKCAKEYYNELMKLPKEIVAHLMVSLNTANAEIAMLTAKNQWKEADQLFEKILEYIKNNLPHRFGYEIVLRKNYAWALERQGRTEEAQLQISETQRLIEKAEKSFAHANIYANFMAKREVVIDEEFEMRLDLVNIARNPSLLDRIEDIVPEEFKVTFLPTFCSTQDNAVTMKDKTVDPFQVLTIKLNIKAKKPGNYNLNPTINYTNDLGENQSFKPEPVTIEVRQAQPTFTTLQGRITTGHPELDRLLLGGIPENHSVILSSPSIDEKTLLITKFIKAGIGHNEITFYITVDAGDINTLSEQKLSNFYLLVCNPQANVINQNVTNLYKVNGIENLTEIDIALAKMFRTLNPQAVGPKRIFIEIISDVLLQHHAVNTRRWLSALLPTLKSKGFTILAVINPQMHASEETQAILSLFDGEIEVIQRETSNGVVKTLRIKKLINQRYYEDELVLTKENLSA